PRKSRRKSACFSRTTTFTPARARRKPSIIPAGPPPTTTQRVCNSSGDLATNRDEWTQVHKTVLRARRGKIILKGDYCCKIDITASATSWTLTAFMQRKSIGHLRRKHGLHST